MFSVVLRRVDDTVHRLENAFLAATLALILAIMLASIAARYLFNAPITWSEELLLIAFVWLIFIAAAASFRHRAHVRVDLLLMVLPRRVAMVLAALSVMLIFAIMGILAMSTIAYLQAVGANQTPMLGVPVGLVFWVIPAAMALSALHILRNIVDDGLDKALASSTEVAGT